ELPQDNLDLERWFRHPKGHERRMHGHRHAGVRLVHEGPTLLAALDAHVAHPGQFTGADLRPYWRVPAPACQRQAMHRRTIMRQARSKQNRALLLVDLERRYLESSELCSGSLLLFAGLTPGPGDAGSGKRWPWDRRPSLLFAHHQDTKRGAIEGSLRRAGTANNQGAACGFGRDP